LESVRGESFPVFETPDLGGVGMPICCDMAMPESSRSLALNDAEVIFLSTMNSAQRVAILGQWAIEEIS
jgi:predicted amidohydrolase